MSRFGTIEEYVDAQADAVREVAHALVATVDEQGLGSRAVWYGHPVWSIGPKSADGPVVYIKAYAKHVTLGFWSVDALSDESRITVGGSNMGSIRIADLATAAELPIAAWIQRVRDAVAGVRA